MDDEEDIRYIYTKMLNRINYEVQVAGDGNEAIELFKRAIGAKKDFDAVIMDLKIADGMGGEEAIKKLPEIDSGAKIILSSGSITKKIMNDFGQYGVSAVLRKPFKKNDLEKVLIKVMSKQGIVVFIRETAMLYIGITFFQYDGIMFFWNLCTVYIEN